MKGRFMARVAVATFLVGVAVLSTTSATASPQGFGREGTAFVATATVHPNESHLCVTEGGPDSTCFNSGFHAHGVIFGCVPDLGDGKPVHVTIGAHMYGHTTDYFLYPISGAHEFDHDGIPHEIYTRWNNGASEWGNAVGWKIETDQHYPGGTWLSLVNITCKHTACGCEAKAGKSKKAQDVADLPKGKADYALAS